MTGLWLLLPGTQLSLTLRSCGSDSSRSVGGSGRSSNRHTAVEQTCHIGAELRIVKRDRTHHHQASRRGLLFQLAVDEAGVLAAIGRVHVNDDKV